MRFMEDYAEAAASGGALCGYDAKRLFDAASLTALPMVDPDGVDLVTGALTSGAFFDAAPRFPKATRKSFSIGLESQYPGIDLNLQYPAGWLCARRTKPRSASRRRVRGIIRSGAPLEPESRAVYEMTRRHDFCLTISLHTQGKSSIGSISILK
jgi:g-D-glutamyl-meso-diaminopimelate peptidase